MSTPQSPQVNTEPCIFINARLLQSRLVNENVASFPSAHSGKDSSSVQIRTDVSSGFSVGLDSTDAPTEMMIELIFKAVLKTEETEKVLVEYESKHAAQFKISGWAGFSDWTDVPSAALAPYFSVVSDMAVRRGESTLLELGIRGIRLPQSDNFDDLSPKPEAS